MLTLILNFMSSSNRLKSTLAFSLYLQPDKRFAIFCGALVSALIIWLWILPILPSWQAGLTILLVISLKHVLAEQIGSWAPSAIRSITFIGQQWRLIPNKGPSKVAKLVKIPLIWPIVVLLSFRTGYNTRPTVIWVTRWRCELAAWRRLRAQLRHEQ